MRALADRAGVSPPTASRLVARLGFDGFADFQAAVRTQDRSRLRSFVSEPSGLDSAATSLRTGLDGSLAAVPDGALTEIAQILTAAGRVWALGGRLSELAAEYLVRQLASLRPGVAHVPGPASARARVLLDLRAGDVVVAYDFRRYSPETARFVTAAKGRGARLILITDEGGTGQADVVVRLPREAAGPIDPITHEVAVTELILVAVAAHLSPAARLAELEELTRTLEGRG
ncbi:MurR/RpiR family transcriptional regulator [Actinoplanes sp. CA-131856]